MNSSGDEDEEFLYGSDLDNKSAAPQGNKRTLQPADSDDISVSKKPKLSEVSASIALEKNHSESVNDSSEDIDSASVSSDEESDSDVEFIISTGTDTGRLDSASTSASVTGAQSSGISVATAPVEPVAEATQVTDANNTESTSADVVPTGSIDLEAEGTFEGQPVTSLDPEVLKEKPWRQPGANLSDYFNYGLNEFTWMEYLHKQEKLQQEYNPHKILMGLLSLQQQGKLNGPKKMETSMNNIGDVSNTNNMLNNNMMNQHSANRAMPPSGFPPLPMFGGFPPFGMPGMMPQMNQNQNQQNKK